MWPSSYPPPQKKGSQSLNSPFLVPTSYRNPITGNNKKEGKNKGKEKIAVCYSARSPICRKTPTSPAMATPSSNASGSSLPDSSYSSGSPKPYSFFISHLSSGISTRRKGEAENYISFEVSINRRRSINGVRRRHSAVVSKRI